MIRLIGHFQSFRIFIFPTKYYAKKHWKQNCSHSLWNIISMRLHVNIMIQKKYFCNFYKLICQSQLPMRSLLIGTVDTPWVPLTSSSVPASAHWSLVSRYSRIVPWAIKLPSIILNPPKIKHAYMLCMENFEIYQKRRPYYPKLPFFLQRVPPANFPSVSNSCFSLQGLLSCW